jgi:hypothetical protein
MIIMALAIAIFPAYGQSDLVAINVLLQPGPRMLAEAANWNAAMRKQFPDGFELDEEHATHITLVQRFVARSDLPKILAAVDDVRSKFDMKALRMKATGFYYIPLDRNGLAGIKIEPSGQLLALQNAIIKAINVYARESGDESAFVSDKSGMPFDPFIFEYVGTFIPRQTGEHFNPHVTVGIAPLGWLKEEKKKPFDTFTFGATGIATYQLGNFGPASKRLDTSY